MGYNELQILFGFAKSICLILCALMEEYDLFCQESIGKEFRRNSNNGEYSQKQVVDQIKALNARITQAKDHFMAGEFTHAELQAV